MRPFVKPTDREIIQVTSTEISPCPDLGDIKSLSDVDFKGAAISWIEQYKQCRAIHKSLVDVVEKFNARK